MEKFIPFEKLSKKEQKRINLQKRSDWNGLNPVTRVADTNAKKYKRKSKYRQDFLE